MRVPNIPIPSGYNLGFEDMLGLNRLPTANRVPYSSRLSEQSESSRRPYDLGGSRAEPAKSQ
jgi:hypothetical protein